MSAELLKLADWLVWMQKQSASLAHVPEMAEHIQNLKTWETMVRQVVSQGNGDPAQTSRDPHSPPLGLSPHNSGESDPAVTQDLGGGETIRNELEELASNFEAAGGMWHGKALATALRERIKNHPLVSSAGNAAQAAPSRHTAIETAIRSYCRRQSSAAVQNGRIYYAGLSITDLVNDIEAALTTSGGDVAAGAWQAIETVPKDGTKVDLLYAYPRGRTIDCMWRQGGVDGDGCWIWLKPIWSSQPGLGIDWHLAPESEWEVCSYPNMEPTHWMRSPSVPSAHSNTEAG